jgi:hypothetical protein
MLAYCQRYVHTKIALTQILDDSLMFNSIQWALTGVLRQVVDPGVAERALLLERGRGHGDGVRLRELVKPLLRESPQ